MQIPPNGTPFKPVDGAKCKDFYLSKNLGDGVGWKRAFAL